MDRPLDAVQQRRRRVAWVARGSAVLTLLVLGGWLATSWLSPSADRALLRSATVEYGAVEAVITAAGTVLPERELVLPSDIDARLLRVLHRAGDTVAPGDPVVLLDVSETRAELARLTDRIALKRNEQARAQATVEAQRIRMEHSLAVLRREAEFLAVKDEQNRAAWERNFIAANELRESALALERARDELAALEQEHRSTMHTGQLQQEGLALELSLLTREKEELERRLALCTLVSDRPGVVTWSTQTEGVIVRRGDILARIADLSSYRVQASVSDAHAARVAVGMPVRVRTGSAVLHGSITAVQPAVENGSVVLSVGVDDTTAALLRPNLRVEVQIITDGQARALRVARGELLWRNGRQEVFVVRGNRAVRTAVVVGLTGSDYYELRSGVQAGDTVILSSMEEYAHLHTVGLR